MSDTLGVESPTQRSEPARPKIQRIAAVLNPLSGSVEAGAAESLAKLVAEYGYDLSLTSPGPSEIPTAVRSAIDQGPDLLVILAGDGTDRLAAELCGIDGPLIAPLPGGTLNMLPRAIYGTRAWPAALRATLDEGVERTMCGGLVHGAPFYVAAILGTPALWSNAREAVRKGQLAQAARRARYAFRQAFRGGLRYQLDEKTTHGAEALVLISPVISAVTSREVGLEAVGLDVHNAQEVFRLAFNGLIGDWRRDPSATSVLCQRGSVKSSRSIPCILDGEVQHLPRQVDFSFKPRAFRVLAPPVEAAK
ncbi:MAG TPA: diacylglycerol kinase family protein [Caulobacteraceae bacterium]